MRYRINLLEDGSVVTRDGEYLGTWGTDETDAFYEFYPDGSSERMFLHPFVPFLCKMIEEWHEGEAAPCAACPKPLP